MSAPTIFILEKMPWEQEFGFTIRLCVPGADEGAAVWMEFTTLPEYTLERTTEVLRKVADALPSTKIETLA